MEGLDFDTFYLIDLNINYHYYNKHANQYDYSMNIFLVNFKTPDTTDIQY